MMLDVLGDQQRRRLARGEYFPSGGEDRLRGIGHDPYPTAVALVGGSDHLDHHPVATDGDQGCFLR